MKIDNCFALIVDENTEILILGTSPGKESLVMAEYYKSTRNRKESIMNFPIYSLYKM